MKREYSVIGDNIVECLRFVDLASISLEAKSEEIESGSLYVRLFYIETLENQYFFYLYPGHNRWGVDVLDQFIQCGLVLKEAPDVLITIRQEGREVPILCVEFCSALSAGNQAWQRHGRALAVTLIGIPYIFITHIGGHELDGKRVNKSLRLPNPTVPLSYFSFSEKNPLFLSAYLPTPDFFHNKDLFNDYDIIDRTRLSQLIKSYLDLSPNSQLNTLMASKNLDFAKLILNKKKGGGVKKMLFYLNNSQKGDIDFLTFLTEKFWNKKITIPIKRSLEEIRIFLNSRAKGIVFNNLPFCVLSQDDIPDFVRKINAIYGVTLSETLLDEDFLIICFVAGFKPKGDDSRPDRGLIPFVRMLLGLEKKLISFVYGPIKQDIFTKIEVNNQSQNLTNGLWQAINSLSNYVILDPSSVKDKFLIWENSITNKQNNKIDISWAISLSVPTKPSEHDIDSFINKLFTTRNFFEGLCNPPGGDWAGISLPNKEFSKELRWTSLPRVTLSSKRPDHIYIKKDSQGINVYIIESKERSSNVENNIGTRLIDYVQDLLIYSPSAERVIGDTDWQLSSENVVSGDYKFYSGFCSFDDRSNKEDFSIFEDNHIDFVILFSRSNNPETIFKSFNQNCDSLIELFA